MVLSLAERPAAPCSAIWRDTDMPMGPMGRRRRRRRRRRLLVGGMIGYGAYKMSKSQADQVQQQSGVDPEEMTDEELAKSMDELGIEKQEITADDKDA